MLYLWGNCWSLSLCSPNLFYILLWPLVLSRPLRQLLLKKGKRKAHIDQDLHVYCQDCDLFYRGVFFFVWGQAAFQAVVKSTKKTYTNTFMTSLFLFMLHIY